VGGTDNPYAAALDGLVLDDPVRAFFDFCRERERVRVRRERGDPPPWSDDPIFQQGRFLNVFREDDRGTRALLGFVGHTEHELPDLIHALFFARWCNRLCLTAADIDDPAGSAMVQCGGLPGGAG
jgi:hypothetical protein